MKSHLDAHLDFSCMDCVGEIRALQAEWKNAVRMRALLREWPRTPFFKNKGDWERWVQKFKPKVQEVLR